MKLLNCIVLISGIAALNPQLAQAQEEADLHPYLTEKFFVDVGIYFPERQFAVTVNGAIIGPSDPIDLGGELGVKHSDETFSLNFGWRFGKKWQLEGQYFSSGGAGGAALEEDVEFGDIVFGAGTGIEASQDFTLVRTFFARRFESSDEHEFGLGAGLHWLRFGVAVKGTVIAGDGTTSFRRESVSAVAPLPNIGAWYMHSISPRLAFKTRLDWLGVKIGDYDGTLINASLGLNYQVFENFGVGVNYNVFDLDVGVKKSDWRGNANISYKGLYVNLSAYW